jgi:hypothetical protein
MAVSPDGVLVGEDVREEAREQLVADPVRVAAHAATAPADDRTADHVAGRLVPVGGDASDDGVVLGVATRVDLAVKQRADERVEREVDGIDRFEHHERVPGDRRMDVVRVEPLHRLGWTGDRRRRLTELDRQRLHDLDLGLGKPDQHRRQLRHGLGPVCIRTPSLVFPA